MPRSTRKFCDRPGARVRTARPTVRPRGRSAEGERRADHLHHGDAGAELTDGAAKPGAFSPLWRQPANDAAEPDPRAITAAHRRRLDGGRLLATAPRLDWARLLQRTYQFDVFRCPRCHGPARVVAAITEPEVIRKILDHVREPPARAPPSGASEPNDDGADADVWLDPEVHVDS